VKTRKRTLILSLGESKDPPTELRLFANGLNETTKGPIICDAKACEMVMSRFQKRGLDKLPFDYGHGMVYGTDHRASAWFVPEGRGGELWATQIQWTPAALTALSNREYRFYSPFCYVGYEDGRILELMNVALLCMPATNGQKPIVATSVGSKTRVTEKIKMDPELARLLGILGCAAVSEVEPKIKALGTHAATVTAQVATLTADNTKLATQVTELSTAAETAKRDGLIATLSAAGKLAPSLHAWAKTQTFGVLESFGAAAPAAVASSTSVTAPVATAPVAVAEETNKILEMFGLTSKTSEFAEMQTFLSAHNGAFVPGEFPMKKAQVS